MLPNNSIYTYFRFSWPGICVDTHIFYFFMWPDPHDMTMFWLLLPEIISYLFRDVTDDQASAVSIHPRGERPDTVTPLRRSSFHQDHLFLAWRTSLTFLSCEFFTMNSFNFSTSWKCPYVSTVVERSFQGVKNSKLTIFFQDLKAEALLLSSLPCVG